MSVVSMLIPDGLLKDLVGIFGLSDKYGDRANSCILSYISDEYQTFDELIANLLASDVTLAKELKPKDFNDLIIFQCGVLASRGLLEELQVPDNSEDGYHYKIRGLQFDDA